MTGKQTVVVFGATGNIGANVALHLKEHGYQVVAVGKRKSDNGFFAAHGITYHSMDICNVADYVQLPKENVCAVANFAGELPSRYSYDPAQLINTITIGTLNVLEYMRKVGCKKIIFPQTPFDKTAYHGTHEPIPADGPRTFPLTGDHSVYTIAKNAAIDLIEHYHAEYGFSRFILRFFTIYQYHPNPYHYRNYKRSMMPYRQLIDKAMKGETIEIWGDPKASRGFFYIKDMVRLVRKCVESEREGGIYNADTGNADTLEKQIRSIVEVFSPKDNPSKIIYCPDKPGTVAHIMDISKTREELGFSPKYTCLDLLRDFKREMEEEPMAQLWGTKKDYE